MSAIPSEGRRCGSIRETGAGDSAAFGRLLQAVTDLSLARSHGDVQRIVRTAARELTGCDGATLVLRDNDDCWYVDEDAIAALWKGARFPLSECVSGIAMIEGRPIVIPDIYADPRVPHEAYRPTFVQSLLMVPIRAADPIGAIGNYWAQTHHPSDTEIDLLTALADSTAVAMENVTVWTELEERVRERTAALEKANREILKVSVTDHLTGLHNRRGFHMLAGPALAGARRRKATCLLAYIDLDGLKQINDGQGHEAGDAAILGAARALRACLRTSDIVARIGGDEFSALVTDTQLDARGLKARIIEGLAAYNPGCDHGVTLAASIGIAEASAEDTIDTLLSRADGLMYAAKKRRRRRLSHC